MRWTRFGPYAVIAAAIGLYWSMRPLAVTRISELEVGNYFQLNSTAGPNVRSITSNPNGVVTAPLGSLRIRTDAGNASIWQNTDGGTTWVRIDLSASTSSTSPSGVPGQFFFGTSYDGTCNFDGVTTPVCQATLSGSTYTLARSIYPHDMTVAAGVRVHTAGMVINATGTIGGTGIISHNGNNATGTTGGAARALWIVPGGNAGLNGATGACGAGTVGTLFPLWCTTNTASNGGGVNGNGTTGTACRGGGGGGGASGGGGEGGDVTVSSFAQEQFLLASIFNGRNTAGSSIYSQVSAGGCGGGDGTAGGGGGGGAGWVVIVARSCGTGGWSVEANGGNGGTPAGGNRGGGGGGAAGTIIVYCGSGTVPTVTLTPGVGSNGTGTGGRGGDGGTGRKVLYSPAGGWVHGTS